MTSNQINYVKQLETERANRVNEQETKRHNLAMEQAQQQANLINREIGLANVAASRFATGTNARAKARENLLTYKKNQQSHAMNVKQQRTNYINWQEQQRHNVATEGESVRHNEATERETHRKNTWDVVLNAADAILSIANPFAMTAAKKLLIPIKAK